MLKFASIFLTVMASSTSGQENNICLTEEDCQAQSEKDELFFRVDEAGVLNTKGCIKKKNVVYWSVGTEEEMSTVTMLGDKERVFCDDEATGSSSITSAPTVLSSAPVTPPTNPPVFTLDLLLHTPSDN